MTAGIAAYWLDGGWLLIPIAAVSFAIWAWWLRLRNGLQGALRCARGMEQRLTAGVDSVRDVSDLFPWRAKHRSGSPAPHACRATWRDAETEIIDFQNQVRRELVVLKALTAAAPLLGLLGTVTGMVDTFSAVAQPGVQGGGVVAQGVSTALITTQFGLLAALPGVFGTLHINGLRDRLDRVYHAVGWTWSRGYR